ncbi:MAG: ABC transporter permease [Anaerolineae bacterium]|nr:ABC transporter permease [Phycisphaerae bacterium]
MASEKPDHVWRRLLHNGRFLVGGGMLLLILGTCIVSLYWTGRESLGLDEDGYPITNPYYFDAQDSTKAEQKPSLDELTAWFGTDRHGRSMLMRCLYGGTVSLEIGAAAALVAVVLGVSVGLIAGYRGGWTDALLMRTVDIMYGLPYVLLIILFKIALEEPLSKLFTDASIANRAVLFMAIGLVSWLTMARVVRGQVLSLRGQPFIEACRAIGLPSWRIFLFHLLPNIVGPIIVYATLTVPQAILSESFLSFLGIGIQAPMPTWGSLAAEGLTPAFLEFNPSWWMLLFPCTLLALTLLSLNFVGDGLRDLFDPKRGEAAKL